jgi:S-adenosyl-L-methionine hydrolase (adenosine-forming)
MKRGGGKTGSGIVTLITDFGAKGEYVGAMKGAILKVNPRCQIVDITHQIGPQNILEASWVLKNSFPFFPRGTVHLVVVDPGVGSRRRPVALKKGGHFLVGPDNGIFTLALEEGEKNEGYEISREELFLSPLSSTFHGRDVFAPVAGRLSAGYPLRMVGPAVKDFVRIHWPRPQLQEGKLRGQILWGDSFGNQITNISREDYAERLTGGPILIRGRGWRIRRISRTYSQGKSGQPMALFGSSGLLEIAVNQGNAERQLGCRSGDTVTICLETVPRRRSMARKKLTKEVR